MGNVNNKEISKLAATKDTIELDFREVFIFSNIFFPLNKNRLTKAKPGLSSDYNPYSEHLNQEIQQ